MRQIALPGVLSLFFVGFTSCAKDTPAPTQQSEQPRTTAETTDHSHGAGRHGGTIADWGGGAFHAEFTVDHDKKEATVYILGSDGKSPAAIKAEKIQLNIHEPTLQIDLVATPLEGESEGMSSRFVGQHDNLGIVREFEGMISGEVEGTPYVGEFKEVAGDHKH